MAGYAKRVRFFLLAVLLGIGVLLTGCETLGERDLRPIAEPVRGQGTVRFMLEEPYEVEYSSDSQAAIATPDGSVPGKTFCGWAAQVGGKVLFAPNQEITYLDFAALRDSENNVKLYPVYDVNFPEVSGNIRLYEYFTPNLLPRIDINTENGIALNDPSLVSQTEKRGGGGKLPAYNAANATISVSGAENQYLLTNVTGQVKIRGEYSSTYPKRPLRIDFDTEQPMLGLNRGAKFKTWILLAEWKDSSMLLNSVAQYIANALLESDGYFVTDFRYVRVYLNGEYNGLYLLVEQPEIDEFRVNIPKLEVPETPEATEVPEDSEPSEEEGAEAEQPTVELSEAMRDPHIGYLLEYDGYFYNKVDLQQFIITYNEIRHYGTNFNGTTFDPTTANRSTKGFTILNEIYTQGQKIFIRQAIQTIWKVVYDATYCEHDDLTTMPYHTMNAEGEYVEAPWITSAYEAVASVIDIPSLVDMYILHEVTQDCDIGFCSFYFSLDMSESGNHLLTYTAPWDFEYALGNSVSDGGGVSATLGALADEQQMIKDGRVVETIGGYCFMANTVLTAEDFVFTNTDTLYAANTGNPWLVVFTNQDWFWQLVYQRWAEAVNAGVFTGAAEMIDTYTDAYEGDFASNFARWNNMGQKVDSEQPEIVTYFRTQAHAAAYLKAWLAARVEGLSQAFTTQLNRFS